MNCDCNRIEQSYISVQQRIILLKLNENDCRQSSCHRMGEEKEDGEKEEESEEVGNI